MEGLSQSAVCNRCVTKRGAQQTAGCREAGIKLKTSHRWSRAIACRICSCPHASGDLHLHLRPFQSLKNE
jgi:hypothetical protein